MHLTYNQYKNWKGIKRESTRCFLYIFIIFCVVSLPTVGNSNFQPIHASTNQYSGISGLDDWTVETPVQIFNRRNGQWEQARYGDVGIDTEFIIDGYFYTVTEEEVVFLKPEIDISQLAETDRAFDPNNWRMPTPEDVVFLYKSTTNQQKGHWLLRDVQSGSEVIFQGKVWNWEIDLANQRFVVSDTGNVFSRVTKTHASFHENDVLALTIKFDSCGKTDIITGSEEHPFYVLDVERYVRMVDLQPDMRLKTDNDSLATVVELKPLNESMELYNLTVAHIHNYYIYTSEQDTGVLVHNVGPCDVISQALEAGLPNRNGRGATTGYLFDSNGNMIEIVSGNTRSLPAAQQSMIRDPSGFLPTDGTLDILHHVEFKAARYMKENNITNATLVINNHPCAGSISCSTWLNNALPIGANLEVVVPDGFDIRGDYTNLFTGH